MLHHTQFHHHLTRMQSTQQHLAFVSFLFVFNANCTFPGDAFTFCVPSSRTQNRQAADNPSDPRKFSANSSNMHTGTHHTHNTHRCLNSASPSASLQPWLRCAHQPTCCSQPSVSALPAKPRHADGLCGHTGRIWWEVTRLCFCFHEASVVPIPLCHLMSLYFPFRWRSERWKCRRVHHKTNVTRGWIVRGCA